MGKDGKDTADNNYGNLKCELLTFEGFGGELGFMIEIPEDNECLSDFIKYGTVGTLLMGTIFTNNDAETTFFNSNGEAMNYGYFEHSTITWEALNSSENPEPAQSEPTSSESSDNVQPSESESASSEPVSSESVNSEPVNESASPEPVSEPASSETSSSPTNVDTGVTGIAAIVGTALLAAGAVIVSRKK